MRHSSARFLLGGRVPSGATHWHPCIAVRGLPPILSRWPDFGSTETPMPIRTVEATRYVTPLREGGSVPAIVEADDDGLYVLKFHGAAQGPRSLVAELISGEIGRTLGLPVPEIVLIELDPHLS